MATGIEYTLLEHSKGLGSALESGRDFHGVHHLGGPAMRQLSTSLVVRW